MGRSEDQVEEVVSWCREQQQGVKPTFQFSRRGAEGSERPQDLSMGSSIGGRCEEERK